MKSLRSVVTHRALICALLAGFTSSIPACNIGTRAVDPNKKDAGQLAGYYQGSQVESGAKAKSDGGLFVLAEPEKRQVPLKADAIDRQNFGDRRTPLNKDWMLFHSRVTNGKALALEYRYTTREDNKYTDQLWGTLQLAFGSNWPKTDISKARYLVLWMKASDADAGIRPMVAIQSTNASKGLRVTDYVDVSEYATNKRIGTDWTKVTIPITAFPDITRVDIVESQSLVFQLAGTPTENKDQWLLLDNVYFTDDIKITPVENVGYLTRGDGILVVWDKAPIERPRRFTVALGDKELVSVPGAERMAIVPKAKLPAGKSHVISITAVGETESANPVGLEVEMKQPPEKVAVIDVEAQARHTISPFIFGTNWAEPETVTRAGITINRWGGVRTTKYNWAYDVDSSGAEHFFMNGLSKPRSTPEDEKGWWGFVSKSADAGAAVNFTLPSGPYIAKPHMEEAERYCAFPKEEFPKQHSFDPTEQCGDGYEPGGETKIWGNDPGLSNVENSVEHQRKFLENVKKLLADRAAAKKRTELFVSLDNEPGLWFELHRDSSPKGLSAVDLVKMNTEYAKLVKDVLPDVNVIGWSAWGALELAGSNQDYIPAGEDGYKRYGEFKTSEDQWRERRKLGYTSQLEYYLRQMAAAEKAAKKRLIDVVDVHWYPETVGVTSTGDALRLSQNLEYDPALAAQQFDALREWYDPTYTNPTWLAQGENKAALWDPFHPVIPALKRTIERNYPGTKLAINEYDVGSRDYFHGALLRVAVLGIFMQEDLYMAQAWYQPNDRRSFIFLAQQLYGNYDGKGGRVGGQFFASRSDNPDILSYVARDKKRWYAVLVNKNAEARMRTTLSFPNKVSRFKNYLFAETLGNRVLEVDSRTANGSRIALFVPAMSAALVVADE